MRGFFTASYKLCHIFSVFYYCSLNAAFIMCNEEYVSMPAEFVYEIKQGNPFFLLSCSELSTWERCWSGNTSTLL